MDIPKTLAWGDPATSNVVTDIASIDAALGADGQRIRRVMVRPRVVPLMIQSAEMQAVTGKCLQPWLDQTHLVAYPAVEVIVDPTQTADVLIVTDHKQRFELAVVSPSPPPVPAFVPEPAKLLAHEPAKATAHAAPAAKSNHGGRG